MYNFSHCNEEQKQAITYNKQAPLLLLAGPGSGKTFTILNRLFFLISNLQIPSEKICVISFTKASAKELQNRFSGMLSKSLDPKHSVYFGTFHSFFYRILLNSKIYKAGQFLSQKEKEQILKSAFEQLMPKNIELEFDSVLSKEILTLFSNYKNTLRKEELYKCNDLLKPYVEELFAKYEMLRKEQGKYDFDDLQYDCYCYLQEYSALCEQWQNYLEAILVDEFQDINEVQFRILQMLYTKKTNLFVVGDDDQAIYGFRGADPTIMRRYQEVFQASLIKLRVNYRSGKEIINISNKVISDNQNRFEKQFVAKNDAMESQAFVKGYESYIEQFNSIAKAYMECEGTGAILFRTNLSMQKAGAYLQRLGFAVELSEKNGFGEEIYRDMLDYLACIYEENEDAFFRILNKPNRYLSKELIASGRGCTVEEFIKTIKSRKNVTAVKALERLRGQISICKKLSLYPGLQYIRKVIGYENYLIQKSKGDSMLQELYLSVLHGICEAWKGKTSLEEIRLIDMERDKFSELKNTIHMMTIHGSKGLEFERVWIPDCNEGMIPYGSTLNPGFTTEMEEEERRILYVGMTRAKKYLELSYVKPTPDSTRKKSRFIENLKEN